MDGDAGTLDANMETCAEVQEEVPGDRRPLAGVAISSRSRNRSGPYAE